MESTYVLSKTINLNYGVFLCMKILPSSTISFFFVVIIDLKSFELCCAPKSFLSDLKHALASVCIRACMHACMHVCVSECVYACVHVCVCVCVCS